MYLLEADYELQIQDDNLNQITSSLPAVRLQAEGAATAEMISYLVQKYDTAKEFASSTVFSMTATYKAGARIYLDAPAFSAVTVYLANALVLQAGNVYKSIAGSAAHAFNGAEWTLLGAQYDRFYAAYPETPWNIYVQYFVGDGTFLNDLVYTAPQNSLGIYPNDPVNGPIYWGTGTAYSFTGFDVLNTTYWTAGDNRNPQTVLFLIDMTLYHIHSRIAPFNIPELRKDRYEAAISWLKAAATGKITADLTRIQPNAGNRIRFGGEPHQTWGY